jgi:hypothetical protein
VVFAARRRARCSPSLKDGRPEGRPFGSTDKRAELRREQANWRSLVELSARGVSFDATMVVFSANQPTELRLLIWPTARA